VDQPEAGPEEVPDDATSASDAGEAPTEHPTEDDPGAGEEIIIPDADEAIEADEIGEIEGTGEIEEPDKDEASEDAVSDFIEVDAIAPAFEQSGTVSGVTVTVRAEAGAFPAGATLSVKAVSRKKERQANAAIDAAQAQEQTVVASYAFDICILDPEGNELQPAEGFDVQVSFALGDETDQGLETSVYHMREAGGELTAEALPVVAETGDTVTALTGGFSIFVVQTAQRANALAANDFEYADVNYIDAKGKAMPARKCAVVTNESKIIGDGWYAVTQDASLSAGMIVWGETNLILCDGATLTANDGIWVQKDANLTIWAQSTGDSKGRIVARGGKEKAGIGGGQSGNAGDGTVKIIDSVVTVHGGEYAAGIGGGKESGDTGGEGAKVYIKGEKTRVFAEAGWSYTYVDQYTKIPICNTRSVKLNRTRLTLKVGRSSTLKANLKGVKPGMKLLDHVPKVRFYSTDANVATVDTNGKVRAVGKGSCTVYAIANNGVRSKVKLTVK